MAIGHGEAIVDGGGLFVFAGSASPAPDDEGCAYILDGSGTCGGPRRPKSPYCPRHHALCHVPEGSVGERRRLNEVEALASVVGGRNTRPVRLPADHVLRQLEIRARLLARPGRSC